MASTHHTPTLTDLVYCVPAGIALAMLAKHQYPWAALFGGAFLLQVCWRLWKGKSVF
jgi:hypothetical protein